MTKAPMSAQKVVLMRVARSVLALLLILIAVSGGIQAATGTITPSPFQLILDNSGNPVNAGCIWTYTAGTSTPVATYTDVALSVANANPIIASTAGRFTAFLTPGLSYKFTYENTPCSASAHGSTLVTADNIAATPPSAANVDTTGTAGEALTAGQVAYLSDGSGGKTPGQWYKADSANPYSSTTNLIAMIPTAISSGATGTIRITGAVTGLSSLTVGATYYVSTTGALTSTAPTNRRVVGQADTATSLVLVGNPGPTINLNSALACGRLTLTTATPVTTADVTAATTLYYTPVSGCNQITLWNGSTLVTDILTEASLAVPATTSTLYDVFAVDTSGTVSLEALAWTNDTTRATAVTLQNGFLAKSGVPTRRYVGSFRTTAVSGQTEDSVAKRYVWNYYHRVRRVLRRLETTATWTYTTATFQQANAAAANQVEAILGIAEVPVTLRLSAVASNTGGGVALNVAIGEDSTTTADAAVSGGYINGGAADAKQITASLDKYPAVGRHYWAWLEKSTAAGTTTWSGTGTGAQSGLTGFIEG